VPLSSFDPHAIPDPKGSQVCFRLQVRQALGNGFARRQAAGLPYDKHSAVGISLESGRATDQGGG